MRVWGCGGAREPTPTPSALPASREATVGPWEGRRSGEGHGGLAMGGPEGAGPGTVGELADPASLWATRAGEAWYQDVMGGRAGCRGLFSRGSSLRGPCWC